MTQCTYKHTVPFLLENRDETQTRMTTCISSKAVKCKSKFFFKNGKNMHNYIINAHNFMSISVVIVIDLIYKKNVSAF